MTKKERFFSLKAKMVAALLTALMVGTIFFQLTETITNTYIEQIYLSEEACAQRDHALLEDFVRYVDEGQVNSKDNEALKIWCRRQEDVYLTIYRENNLVFETDGDQNSVWKNEDQTNEISGEYTDAQILESDFDFTIYPVQFSDGVFPVSIIDFSESSYYELGEFLSWTVFFLIILVFMLIYISRVTGRITKLSHQVAVIGSGDLQAELKEKGRDELGLLAGDVDSMRHSLVQGIENEKKVWRTNQELITSISHDLRNPLTSLIGYTELLTDEIPLTEEERKRYLLVCRDKAYQLKGLTDELFSYFLVFGNTRTQQAPEVMDARILLEQLLGEQIARLRSEGFQIQEGYLQDSCQLEVDVMLLKRMIDNLFSNIGKYAEKEKPVQVQVCKEKAGIRLHFENYVRKQKNPVESTRIGVKTCQKIAQIMGASFFCGEENGVYRTDLVIPEKSSAGDKKKNREKL